MRHAQAVQTVPTGFAAVPPAGPATPLTATANSAPERSKAPCAMASTAASLTAPWLAKSASVTPKSCCLAVLD